MRILTFIEAKYVNGAYALFTNINGFPTFAVTGDSFYKTGILTVNKKYTIQSLAFFSDHVNDSAGNLIFSGHSGSFCHSGVNFSVVHLEKDSGNAYQITDFC